MRLEIERRAVLDLVPYEKNSKNHGEEDISAIVNSINRFGFNDPIAVTPEGVIIEGHGRWAAVQRLGWADVPVLVIEGLSEDQYDLYRIAHNKIALTSQHNFTKLFDALQELVGGDSGIAFGDMGFNDRAVHDLYTHFGDHEVQGSSSPIDAPSVGASSAALEYDVIWDNKEDKARFSQFIADEVAAGGDKSMGGELLMAAVKQFDPDLYNELVTAVPGTMLLDEIAGTTEQEQVHVAF